ncbi:MAG: hypothetical protein H5T84_10540, partial [Thermoleophilia bacterium]|nr:hypothetical protein [Thermoleophilia bacterium]
MGNPILCDDAVGIRLARDFRAYLKEQAGPACLGEQASVPRTHGQGGPLPVGECQVDFVEECSVGGLNLVDLVAGYDRLIV